MTLTFSICMGHKHSSTGIEGQGQTSVKVKMQTHSLHCSTTGGIWRYGGWLGLGSQFETQSLGPQSSIKHSFLVDRLFHRHLPAIVIPDETTKGVGDNTRCQPYMPTTYLDGRQDPGVDEQLSGIFLMSCCDVRDKPFLRVQQNFSQRWRHLKAATAT